MYGVVTRNAEEVGWPEFDRGFYEVKDVIGREVEPVTDGVNMVSFFGDNHAVEHQPDLAAVDADGEPATRERRWFDWDYVCPTNERYREGLLEIVADAADANSDVRFDDVGFPRPEFCRCERCDERFRAWAADRPTERSAEPGVEDPAREDWFDWRAGVVTDVVAAAAERVPGTVYCTLFPDPYPGHLYERAGVDVAALAAHVDEFVVPIYDMAYTTTYWVTGIARGFDGLLDRPFGIELYAVDLDLDNLVHAARVAEEFATGVYFGYDASNARAAVRRLTAVEGDTYRPGDEVDGGH